MKGIRMKQTRQFICAGCGFPYEVTMSGAAFKRATGTPVCSHTCYEKVNQ